MHGFQGEWMQQRDLKKDTLSFFRPFIRLCFADMQIRETKLNFWSYLTENVYVTKSDDENKCKLFISL